MRQSILGLNNKVTKEPSGIRTSLLCFLVVLNSRWLLLREAVQRAEAPDQIHGVNADVLIRRSIKSARQTGRIYIGEVKIAVYVAGRSADVRPLKKIGRGLNGEDV